MKLSKSTVFAALPVLLLSLSAFAADSTTPIEAVTKPSQDVVLSFTHPGRVAELLVKEGDTVKAGQIVAKQDDTEEQAALDVAQAQADDNTRYEAQEKVQAQKQKAYENKKSSRAASQSEIDEALLDVEVAKANVRLSNFEHVQDGRKALQARATLEKTRLKTPIAGIVEQTMVKAGESVDTQSMKVMRIVNIDPLWIEVPVPFSLARTLKNDSSASIVFSNKEKREGKVIHVATVADSASDTLLVRVEVKNDAKTPAGERVSVSFPHAAVAANQ
jgi:RND family efflux transporter MFP subunit